jgi:hypothetical protein
MKKMMKKRRTEMVVKDNMDDGRKKKEEEGRKRRLHILVFWKGSSQLGCSEDPRRSLVVWKARRSSAALKIPALS